MSEESQTSNKIRVAMTTYARFVCIITHFISRAMEATLMLEKRFLGLETWLSSYGAQGTFNSTAAAMALIECLYVTNVINTSVTC